MIVLTVNDLPSGVYESQVIDVVRYLNIVSKSSVRLVSFVPVRTYFDTRRTLKKINSDIKVLPMFPGLKNWKKTKFILRFVAGIRGERILARGPMAAYLALQLNKDVVYDGRGAVKAELSEFPNIISNKKIVEEIIDAERMAVIDSKMRIAVSMALVEYWRSEFRYSGNDYVVIPCTISNSAENSSFKLTRFELGFNERDVVLVFSGGTGEWQGLTELVGILENWITEQNIKVIFLSKENHYLTQLKTNFPENIFIKWVDKSEVSEYLNLADYGLLIRQKYVTNQVASPVKFAEYLYAGLKVIISPSIGDFSSFVEEHQVGIVLNNNSQQLLGNTEAEKQRIKILAKQYFTKEEFSEEYKSLFK